MADKVSRPCKEIGKIAVFLFLDYKLEDRRFCAGWVARIPWIKYPRIPHYKNNFDSLGLFPGV
jgi:hypothetical protein